MQILGAYGALALLILGAGDESTNSGRVAEPEGVVSALPGWDDSRHVLLYNDRPAGHPTVVAGYERAVNLLGLDLTFTNSGHALRWLLAARGWDLVISGNHNTAQTVFDRPLRDYVMGGGSAIMMDWRLPPPASPPQYMITPDTVYYLRSLGFLTKQPHNYALITPTPGGLFDDMDAIPLFNAGWGIFSVSLSGTDAQVHGVNAFGRPAILTREYPGGNRVVLNGMIDDCIGDGGWNPALAEEVFGREVLWALGQPLILTPLAEVSRTLPYGGPLDAAGTVEYMLRNPSDEPVDWALDVSASWVSVEPSFGTIAPHSAVKVHLTPMDEVVSFVPGYYSVQFSFVEPSSMLPEQFRFRLHVLAPMSVSSHPGHWFVSYFVGAGPSVPPAHEFPVANVSLRPLDLHVSVDVPWLAIEDGRSFSTTIEALSSTVVVAQLNDAVIAGLPLGSHDGHVSFTDLTTGFGATTRTIRVNKFPP